MSKVYIDKAEVEYGEESYEAAKNILRKAKFKLKNKKVLIKPNLVTSDSSISGITADISFCKAILDKLDNCKVTIGNDSNNFKQTHYDILEKEYNCEIVCFDKLEEKDIIFKPVKTPFEFNEIPIAKHVLDADYVVSLAKLKIHALCQVTLSLKNMFGCVPTRHHRVRIHPSIRKALLDILQVRYPDFGLVDGIIGNQVEEVASNPMRSNILLASHDPLALDVIGTRCMGIDENDIEFLKRAIKFYKFDVNKIDVIGEQVKNVMKEYNREFGLKTKLRYAVEMLRSKVIKSTS
ncbi:MAG: hypothetical protein CMH64_00475 [Nanoarchaeota archaeon]|nr:hypothetical protein [Nanoarchaeota archaeon]|tara:strand:+ start:353 stop:1231 length:879 start_codon:yes stop_codon:yes gene_type:complete